MEPEILEIDAHDTLAIRHKVMWPDKPLDYVKLPKDDTGRHFGLYIHGKLISVVSLFFTGKEVQFRKFATLETHQGKGYGSRLLHWVIEFAKNENSHRIWCNARVNKAGFYRKFGMKETKNTFLKGGIAYVIMEKDLQEAEVK